jgi:hypothetical protein
MKKLKALKMKWAVSCVVFFLSYACANEPPTKRNPIISASIDHVETYRVDNNLVRIIRYNMELEPKIQFEIFSTPDMKLINSLALTGITLDSKYLNFSNADGAYIESIKVENNIIVVELEYFYSGGSSALITCKLAVAKANFQALECAKHR